MRVGGHEVEDRQPRGYEWCEEVLAAKEEASAQQLGAMGRGDA